MVRCAECHSRLFDVSIGYVLVDGIDVVPDGSLVVERKCPSCKLLNDGRVTNHDGRPLASPDALNGPWRCPCGVSLGHVDIIRGRVRVTCRCGYEVRVIGAEVIGFANSRRTS
jgi:phage FluMu protein Com